MIFDAPLTELGFEQAADARNRVSKLGITRVITSPLTRAIQTANTIFDGVAPIEVNHAHHELLKFSGDVGRPPEALKRDFPDLYFEHLPSRWWYGHDEVGIAVPAEPMPIFQNRIAQFAAQLNNVIQEAVAIVDHGNAFQEIIDFMLKNCELHQYR